jgi:hypothetical protein
MRVFWVPTVYSIIFFCCFGAMSSARAETCTADAVPGATLLLPYFEVDLGNQTGKTTLFSVNNAGAAAVLANIVLWTNASVPTININLYLTGYDVQTLNLYDIFQGILPASSVIGGGDCNTIPTGSSTQLTPSQITGLRNAHLGVSSSILGNQCGGISLGDNLARGYITVDSVSTCTNAFPSTSGYFVDGGGGIANNNNTLWGDYFFIDSSSGVSQGENLISIEASASDFSPGDYTFYGRYVGFNSADNREPLGNVFGVRFEVGGTFEQTTKLIVWRDSGLSTNPFSCISNPSWHPLQTVQIVVFDDEENPDLTTTLPSAPFPLESNSVDLGSTNFPLSYDSGWIYLNLATTVSGAGINPNKQAFVGVLRSSFGRFSTLANAVQLDAGCPN